MEEVKLTFILLEVPWKVINCDVGPIDDILVTGEFDGWRAVQYHLELGMDGVYRSKIPVLEDHKDVIFKFQINGNFWTTLSSFETIWDNEGHLNNILSYKDCKFISENDIDENVTINEMGSTLDCREMSESTVSHAPHSTAVEENTLHKVIFSPRITTVDLDESKDDYINVSSNGELSSIENLELDMNEMEENVESTLQFTNRNEFSTDYKPLFNLVTVTKKMRTFLNK
ncbi:hypothetical protein Kpol_1070p35 [Vanderwaltozyma polyspora DSM 70294]|uniref:AMP-activated protein kinase glycogen-binding domain-containing protein n=1 Tax=Vanderwaltozyma polyspora (strain ATCC 22028 / DSM 70294 / BCRC 21397 / CBS 2163 / NBRC 10782 / NRRL Y-8283 / UCD 57-17) TaxID=436907 RepID=A7TNN5_VANPO|nr:uncharacterized protein Kpol_1070p35 [Vanderwaltozyma polyspora DSM 70294]EDO16152.1 hypothetical protein Kpol_1070p35 [Vanderwaltozyma polyspora DSM 70294]